MFGTAPAMPVMMMWRTPGQSRCICNARAAALLLATLTMVPMATVTGLPLEVITSARWYLRPDP